LKNQNVCICYAAFATKNNLDNAIVLFTIIIYIGYLYRFVI